MATFLPPFSFASTNPPNVGQASVDGVLATNAAVGGAGSSVASAHVGHSFVVKLKDGFAIPGTPFRLLTVHTRVEVSWDCVAATFAGMFFADAAVELLVFRGQGTIAVGSQTMSVASVFAPLIWLNTYKAKGIASLSVTGITNATDDDLWTATARIVATASGFGAGMSSSSMSASVRRFTTVP